MELNHRSQSARRRQPGVHRDRPRAAQSTAPRRCARCTQTKPISEFRRDSRGFWRSWCNPCQLAATREWKARHRDELLARRRAQRRKDPMERVTLTVAVERADGTRAERTFVDVAASRCRSSVSPLTWPRRSPASSGRCFDPRQRRPEGGVAQDRARRPTRPEQVASVLDALATYAKAFDAISDDEEARYSAMAFVRWRVSRSRPPLGGPRDARSYRLNPRSWTVSDCSASWGLSPSAWSRSPFGPVAHATQPEPRMAGSTSRGPHTTPRSVQSDGFAAIAPLQSSVSPLAAIGQGRAVSRPIADDVP